MKKRNVILKGFSLGILSLILGLGISCSDGDGGAEVASVLSQAQANAAFTTAATNYTAAQAATTAAQNARDAITSGANSAEYIAAQAAFEQATDFEDISRVIQEKAVAEQTEAQAQVDLDALDENAEGYSAAQEALAAASAEVGEKNTEIQRLQAAYDVAYPDSSIAAEIAAEGTAQPTSSEEGVDSEVGQEAAVDVPLEDPTASNETVITDDPVPAVDPLEGPAASTGIVVTDDPVESEAEESSSSIDQLSSNLILAAADGDKQYAISLIIGGANINAVNSNGDTALMMAAENGHNLLTQHLLNQGADHTMTNSDGQTALALASEQGHSAIKALLESQ